MRKSTVILTLAVIVLGILLIRANGTNREMLIELTQAQENYAQAQQNIANQVGINAGNIATIVDVMNPDAKKNLENVSAERPAVQEQPFPIPIPNQ